MFFCIRVLCLLLGTPNSKHGDPTTKNYLRCLLLGGGAEFSNRGKGLIPPNYGYFSIVLIHFFRVYI